MYFARTPGLISLAAAAAIVLAGCPEPEDEPELEPSITVEDQDLDESDADLITIDDVSIDDDGFAVIYDDEEGEPGEPVGASGLLEEGDHQNFTADLERNATDGETLWGVLHYDETGAGAFEDEDDQPPVFDLDDEMVRDDFTVTIDDDDDVDDDDPALAIDDQSVDSADDATVEIDSYTIDDDGFVVLFDDDGGEPGDVLGATDALAAGTGSDISVQLDESVTDGQTLWGQLHYDETDAGQFEDATDQPAVVDADENPVRDDFVVTVEEDEIDLDPDNPSVHIDDQTLPEDDADIINVTGVAIDDDGFVVIHDDGGDEPGNILGYTDPIEQGVHEDIEAALNDRDAADGETMWATLHYNEDDDAEFTQANPVYEDENEETLVTDSFQITIDFND